MPALRGVGAAEFAEHLPPAQTQLDGDVVDGRVAGRRVAGHQPRVVAKRGEKVAGTQVAGTDPLLPRHPCGCQQRRRTRHQHDLADRRVVGTGMSRDHDCPLPAAVSGQVGQEAMGGGGVVVVGDADVLADRVAAELDDRGFRLLDRPVQDRCHIVHRIPIVPDAPAFSHTGSLRTRAAPMVDNRTCERTAW